MHILDTTSIALVRTLLLDSPGDNQKHDGDDWQQHENDPQMLHNPAGNVYGVRRNLRAGIEWNVPQSLRPLGQPVGLGGPNRLAEDTTDFPCSLAFCKFLDAKLHFDAVWIVRPLSEFPFRRPTYSVLDRLSGFLRDVVSVRFVCFCHHTTFQEHAVALGSLRQVYNCSVLGTSVQSIAASGTEATFAKFTWRGSPTDSNSSLSLR